VAEELKENIQQVISNISQRRALLNISKCVNKICSLPASRGMSFGTSLMI
jgi:hypothetical protein